MTVSPSTSAAPETALLPPVSFDTMMTGGREAVETWFQINRAVVDAAGRIAQEYGRFVMGRLNDDFASQKQLSACRTPVDFIEMANGFAQKAVRDYMDEATRLTAMATEAFSAAAVTPAPSAARRQAAD
ncbi:phasin family protein [Tistrella mobilis]|uniref:Phasin domain-containing protein n=1 Tax=Tistrella mobilis TaxID=171437 RepID=A0A162KAP9_9PROT|nr:phasin family protein [Tistrella mobilis]KYO50828.1 hypothetical protein AUP44_01205 [Tistrella mobilis]